MSPELLVFALDDVMSRLDDPHQGQPKEERGEAWRASCARQAATSVQDVAHAFSELRLTTGSANSETVREHAEAAQLAYEKRFIAACAQGWFGIEAQALARMEDAALDGVRLALGSRLSSRMVCALMESTLGPDWVDRFSVVATADALSGHQSEDELYRLILRTTGVPPQHASLVTASKRCNEIARRLGMQVERPNAHDGAFARRNDNGREAWPTRDTRSRGAPRTAPSAAP